MYKHSIVAVANKGQSNERSVSFNYEMGSTIEELVKQFGADIVYQHAVDNLVIAVQARTRSLLNREGDDFMKEGDVVKAMVAYKPKGRKAADPAKKKEAVTKAVASMSAAERKALLAELAKIG